MLKGCTVSTQQVGLPMKRRNLLPSRLRPADHARGRGLNGRRAGYKFLFWIKVQSCQYNRPILPNFSPLISSRVSISTTGERRSKIKSFGGVKTFSRRPPAV